MDVRLGLLNYQDESKYLVSENRVFRKIVFDLKEYLIIKGMEASLQSQ